MIEAIGRTQAIAHYAGADVYYGFNPDFADLRSLSPDVVTLSQLNLEPFEPGSFIISARLEADPLSVNEVEGPRKVTAEDVVFRFQAILQSLKMQSFALPVSIGAIREVESLGSVLRREADAIEFWTLNSLGVQSPPVRVDKEYIVLVNKVRESRRPTREKLETLEGRVTALDIREGKLQLSVEGRHRRVTGHFAMLFLPSLLESLGRHVRLKGLVEYRQKRPVVIQVMDAELLGDES